MQTHYGVVRQNGVWTIIGRGLRFGSYRTRASAETAARRLAVKSALPVQLHVQDESGELLPPTEIN
jgi:hypothetical protein